MVAPVNEFDTRLQAEPKRTLAPRGGLILSATANLVTVADSVGTPSIITLVATPLVVSGSVEFSTSPSVPLTFDPTGLIATLRYADMGTSSVVVTATLTSNGIPYTDSRTISQVSIGSLGYQGALDATRNNTAQGALSARPAGADGDFYFATDALVLYQKTAGAWRAAGNNFTNTSQLIDGAGLGQTASWPSVGGPGRPQDNANYTSASKGAALNDDPGLENSIAWSLTANVGLATAAGGSAVGHNWWQCGAGADEFAIQIRRFPVDPNKTYSLTAMLFAAAGNNRNMYLFMNFYDVNGGKLFSSGLNGTMSLYLFAGQPPIGDWTRQGGNFGGGTPNSIPAGTRMAEVGVWFQYSNIGNSSVAQGAQDIRCEEITLAANAAAAAAAANAAIAAISSDSVLSRGEKADAVLRYNTATNEANVLAPQADALLVDRTAFTAAYISLNNYLNALGAMAGEWRDTSKDTAIVKDNWDGAWGLFYYEKQRLINALAAKAAMTSTWAGTTGLGKPQDNATVGANLNSNVTGSINDTNAPSLVTVSSASKLTTYLGTFRTGTTGQRAELSDGGLKVVSTNGATIRVGSTAL